MEWLLSIIVMVNSFIGFDFSDPEEIDRWRVINDNVMGGISKGNMQAEDDHLLFTGRLSLENNGGFASIRAPYAKYDLSEFDGVEIECSGEGGEFALVLENHREWYRPTFRATFSPEGEWKTFRIPMEEFRQFVVGRERPGDFSTVLRENVIRMGIVKGDKNTDPFSLRLRQIRFYVD